MADYDYIVITTTDSALNSTLYETDTPRKKES